MVNKKNKGVIPPLPLIKINGVTMKDERVLSVPVGCQKCIECMKMKARSWNIRLQEDIKKNKNGHFVTLTFNEESLIKLGEKIALTGYNLENEITTKAIRLFLERWRKRTGKSVRHWFVNELGHKGTERIHIHGIIWTDEPEKIDTTWGYGYTHIGDYVNSRTINYITKYVTKTDIQHPNYQTKMHVSAGIGKNYIEEKKNENNKYKNEKTQEYYVNEQGYKMGLPIYYRNHTYTDEEKEKLWTEKLDKNERYVLGIKIKEEKYKNQKGKRITELQNQQIHLCNNPKLKMASKYQ